VIRGLNILMASFLTICVYWAGQIHGSELEVVPSRAVEALLTHIQSLVLRFDAVDLRS
jgi:hypothetical protein